MAKRKAMGRGLSAILNENISVKTAQDKGAEQIVGNVLEIPLNKIKVNPYQPRTIFDEEALKELAQSIKQLGVIQPITVSKKGDNFQLISGERRFRASKKIGLKTIPAFIRLANDQEMLEMALVENIQREDLDAIEIALSYQRLIDEIDLTQEEMSVRIGKNRSTISNYLRLLKLPPKIQTGIRDGVISMGHGRCIIGLDKKEEQLSAYKKIIVNHLSVRQTESLIKTLKNNKGKDHNKKVETGLPKNHAKALEKLTYGLNTEVEIKRNNKGKGKIVISFDSDDEFIRIKDLLV